MMPYRIVLMVEHVRKRTCEKRFEARFSRSIYAKLMWLVDRTGRSGNSILREAVERMHEQEERKMLEQAGYREERR